MKKRFLIKTWTGVLAAATLLFLGWQMTKLQSDSQNREMQKESADTHETSAALEEDEKENINVEKVPQKEKQELQQDSQKSPQDSMEVSHIDPPEPVLDFGSIQAMEAGTTLDVSKIEENMVDSLFYSEEVSEELRQRISGVSFQENDNISLSELRYIRVLHMGFDGETHIGELLVNASIAEDILEIMSELYKNSYPIEKMVLVDEYGAEDELSMSDNNTSSFNYREIAGSSRMSRHSLGVAIDINPRYNPSVKTNDSGELVISPANGADYADRSQEFEHKIDENDLCFQLFTEHGFSWGGHWNSLKDYQHFEK